MTMARPSARDRYGIAMPVVREATQRSQWRPKESRRRRGDLRTQVLWRHWVDNRCWLIGGRAGTTPHLKNVFSAMDGELAG
jgi:hypothetical protein